ncbi:hypothetical protein BD560DRAFT_383388, partial [Blakeslea trispora]
MHLTLAFRATVATFVRAFTGARSVVLLCFTVLAGTFISTLAVTSVGAGACFLFLTGASHFFFS